MVDAAHSATQTLQAHQRSAELKQSPRPRASTTANAAGTLQQAWRGRDVVFVDPLDSSVPYWWPAMIVPTDEVDATMGCTRLGAEEYLVKYFEDFKYSTVNGSELRIFDTSQSPFTEFAKKSTSFLRDKAIKGALSYLKTGHVHTRFQWRLWMTGSETLRLPFVLSPSAAAESTTTPILLTPTSTTPTTAMLPGRLGSSKSSLRSDHLPNSPSSSPPPLPAHTLTSAAESDVSTLVSAAVAIVTDDDDGNNNTGARSLPTSPGDEDNNDEPEDAQGDDEDEDEDDNNSQPRILSKRSSKLASTPESATRTSPELATPLPAIANKRLSHMHGHSRAPVSQPRPVRRGRPPLSSNRQKPPARQQTKRKQANSSPTLSAWTPDKLSADQLQDSLNDESPAILDIVRDMEEAQDEYKLFKILVRNAAKDLWLEMGNEWPPNIGTSTRFGKRRKMA
ncbi:hypothetical protein GGI20_003797 [Coemansia sp. BCRC 34301]|nr:hypothetical protein GGI20_003797 [Coemansia sp. BCRC 34301]